MNFILDILIPKNEIEKLNIKEWLFEWGGESFSQDPPIYMSENGLQFKKVMNLAYYPRYYQKYMKDDLNISQCISLTLCGDYLSELEVAINKINQNENANILLKFLAKLSELNNFAVFLIRDEEEIDSRYQISTKEELIKIFYKCLDWDSPEGALIIKKSFWYASENRTNRC